MQEITLRNLGRQVLTLAFWLLTSLQVVAQSGVVPASTDGQVLVWGNVRDLFNQECLAGVRVDLLSPNDSSVVVADTCRNHVYDYAEGIRERVQKERKPEELVYYAMSVKPGKYLLRLLCRGYAPKVVSVEVPSHQNGRPLKRWNASDVWLQRVAERQLGEAVVTATKIMMVNKGDTVVFNADYFQLAQGNMLDKLVSMIPGLEIKGGGQILYQGNPLQTLLVNGKDFFKGDASVALRNLPAYMVNTVNIYRKGNDDDYLKVRKDSDEDRRPNTIDIILKKEYNRGWITNYELAAGPALGTSDAWGNKKYLARLFALSFTNRTQLGVIGNFNNVSDTQVAGADGAWSEGWKPENGVTKLAFGGVTFNREKLDKSVKYHFDLRASHETTTLQSNTSGTTFLPSGDVFRRASFDGTSRRAHYTFSDGLSVFRRKFHLFLPISFDFWNKRSSNLSLSAQFSGNPADSYRGASLDSIFLGPLSPRLLNLMVNQVRQQSLAKSRDLQVGYSPYFSVQIPGIEIFWRTRLKLQYSHQSGETFEHYDLKYAHPAAENDQNRYFNQPSHAFDVQLQSSITFGETFKSKFWHDAFEQLKYNYDRKHQSGHRDIYDLHRLPDADQPQELGGLPSVQNWRELCLNEANSYFQRRTEEEHVLTPVLKWGRSEKEGHITFLPKFSYHHQQFLDTRSQQHVAKHYAFFETYVQYALRRGVSNLAPVKANALQQVLFVTYNYNCTPPSINYLVDVTDESDPLRISRGNNALRSQRQHSLEVYYMRGRPRRSQWTTTFECRKSVNDLAMSCTYDAATGAYTYRPANVNGNWSTHLATNYRLTFGPQKMGNFTAATSWRYLHSVDLLDGQLSTVRNHGVQERLSLQRRFGKLATVTLQGTAEWSYAGSARASYHTRHTWDFQYGPDLSLHLLPDLTLSTDLNICQRTGYDDLSMNDCDFVWNASLSFDFDFRRSSYSHYHTVDYLRVKQRGGTGARPWTIRITGHDILQQLSTTRRVLNAQGITETRYNAVPAYAMLSLSYRFSKTPRKH